MHQSLVVLGRLKRIELNIAVSYLIFWLFINFCTLVQQWDKIPYQNDFAHYFGSASLLLLGRNPYCVSFDSLSLPNMRWDDVIASSTNTPFHILLTAPFAFLGIQSAWYCWIACNLIAGGIAVSMVSNLIHGTHRRGRLALTLLGFAASYAFIDNLIYSQVQLIILLLVVLGVREFKRGKIGSAACYWGLSCAIKPLAFLLVAFLAGRREIKAVILFLGTLALACLLPLPFGGPDLYHSYIECAVPLIQKWSLHSLWNISIIGLIGRSWLLIGQDPSGLLIVARLAVPLTVLVAVFALSKRTSEESVDSVLFLAAGLSFFSLEVAWPSYLVVLLLPLSHIWERALWGRKTPRYIFFYWMALNLKPLLETAVDAPVLAQFRSLYLPTIAFVPIVSLIYLVLKRPPIVDQGVKSVSRAALTC